MDSLNQNPALEQILREVLQEITLAGLVVVL